MELKFVIPNMEKTFGNLEFAGEDKVVQRRINGQLTVLSRSYNLYSDDENQSLYSDTNTDTPRPSHHREAIL
jgi:hypothetical protein